MHSLLHFLTHDRYAWLIFITFVCVNYKKLKSILCVIHGILRSFIKRM